MKKRFDAVEFQRKMRQELGKQYSKSRNIFLTELKEKYGYFRKQKVHR